MIFQSIAVHLEVLRIFGKSLFMQNMKKIFNLSFKTLFLANFLITDSSLSSWNYITLLQECNYVYFIFIHTCYFFSLQAHFNIVIQHTTTYNNYYKYRYQIWHNYLMNTHIYREYKYLVGALQFQKLMWSAKKLVLQEISSCDK